MRKSIYRKMAAAGCKIDNHESDLYVLATSVSREILSRYPTERANTRSFVSEIDGRLWLDIPFSFDPWWQAKVGTSS